MDATQSFLQYAESTRGHSQELKLLPISSTMTLSAYLLECEDIARQNNIDRNIAAAVCAQIREGKAQLARDRLEGEKKKFANYSRVVW